MGLETLGSLIRPLYWIPTVKCPTLAACSLSCDQGYATNAEGCTVCRCVAHESSCSPSFTSSQCPIMDLCPYGLATSEIGCLICKCRRPTPCPATVPIFCRNPCPHGFASNTFGCPNIASCDCITPANSALCHPEVIQNCKRHCFHGYATDSDGCEICRCRMPFTLGAFFSIAAPVFNVFWQETNHPHMPYAETSLVPASPCPLVDSRTCQEDCPNGLATDMGGCPLCRCKTLAELCPRVDPVICPQVNACPYGLATGPTGCDICICKDKVSCEPVNHLTCSTSCPHGHATDENGCEICQRCLKHAGDCPPVIDCEKHCSYGYASNDEGCPVCKCKQAASHFPLRSTLHSELFDTYMTTRCSAVSCDLHCHHGYQLDARGCGLCECIPGK
ncbi:cysteine-rich motor neuron 1 protein [Strongylocentrotus purpuratus]|uniref:Antistasin-like domain-containing protein n=1 Tax=Strongylocentrotus purpuratus TaxID=7668 RepID=A0A7M7SVU5_STRPU|nr:cysteine-rich motor neuron 1 protein [Strongylocentrotus purpuratus]